MRAVVEMKQRNPRWGCPRIAEQMALAFGMDINKDLVRRILAAHYQPPADRSGPSWLTFLGHAKDTDRHRRKNDVKADRKGKLNSGENGWIEFHDSTSRVGNATQTTTAPSTKTARAAIAHLNPNTPIMAKKKNTPTSAGVTD
jgi:hypothetical protein